MRRKSFPFSNLHLVSFSGIGLLLIVTSLVYGNDPNASMLHPYEGFIQPYRTIKVAANESGRIAKVMVRRGDVVTEGQKLLLLDTSILEATRKIVQANVENRSKIEILKVEHESFSNRLATIQKLDKSGKVSPEERKKAKLDEQIAKLRLMGANQERLRRQLELSEIDARIGNRAVASPIYGTVTDVLRESGEFVNTHEPHVVTVVDLSRLKATFYLPTLQALQLQKGQKVNVLVPQSDWNMKGFVEHVGIITLADSGRVRVDVVVDNTNNQYRAGLKCRLDHPASVQPSADANSFMRSTSRSPSE